MSKRTQHRPDLRTTLDVATTVHTNATFIRNMPDEFDNNLRQRKLAEAKAHAAGVSTTGKRFVGSLAPKGDIFSPEAWVSESDAKDEIKARCVEQGKHLDDGMKTLYEPPERDTPDPNDKPYRVNDAIVKRAVKQEVTEMTARGEPAPTAKQKITMGEKLREIHSGAYA